MAMLFAAAHPNRVEALVLYGAYAKRVSSPDYPIAQSPEDRLRYTIKLVTELDWEADFTVRCPSADAQMARWWSRRCRAAATPATVRALLDMNALVDVRSILSAVRVPTLILHRRDDHVCSIAEGRYLAEHISDSVFVELTGADHFVSGDPDSILEPTRSFLSTALSAAAPATALAAVVVIAGPDAARFARGLESTGGRIGQDRRGNLVAAYDGPARAIRAVNRAFSRSPDHAVSAGLHVAVVPRAGRIMQGTGVEVAASLARLAPVGELWTTTEVRDLVADANVVLARAAQRVFTGDQSRDVFRSVR